MGADLVFSRSLGCSAVLVDQAAEDRPRSILAVMQAASLGRPQRGFLLQALVRPVAVVVPGVLGQDLAEMPLAEDKDVIQAFAA